MTDFRSLCVELADTLDYWLKNSNLTDGEARELVERARAARRPKPPSLKEQALKVLPAHTPGLSTRVTLHPDDIALVRRALEQLDD